MEYIQSTVDLNGPINNITHHTGQSITIADFERICRTCLTIGEDIRPIFEITHDTISMHTILDTLIALRVRKKDDLPKHLCLNCITEMCRFYTFRDKCRNVQNVLESIQLQALKKEQSDHDPVKEEIVIEVHPNLQEDEDDDLNAIDDFPDDFGELKPPSEHQEVVPSEVKPENDSEDDDDVALADIFKLVIKKSVTEDTHTVETKQERMRRERRERKERRAKKEQATIGERHERRRKTRGNNKRKLMFNDVTKIKHRKQHRKPLKSTTNHHNGLNSPSSPCSSPTNSLTAGGYKCRDCPESFNSRHALHKHRRDARHPEVRTHECHICRKMFTSSKLRQHMRSHTKEKPFVCKVCGKGFTMSGNLKRHTMSHTGERPHVCEICGKGFIQHTTLIAHRRVHAKTYDSLPGCDEPQFSCEQCGRGFKRLWRFNQHLTRHHTQQTHPNLISLPAVTVTVKHRPQVQQVQQVQQVPDRQQMYVAKVGESGGGEGGGGEVGAVVEGNGTNASNSNPPTPSTTPTPPTPTPPPEKHACSICLRSYKSKLYLKSHMATHGEKKFLCSDCGKGFVTKAALQSHLKVHTGEKPHKCTLCQKSFAHVGSFESHMLIHTGQKPYSCNICGKNFTQLSHLKYHLRIHSGEKPYACSYCGKCFALKGNLTVHVRTHTGETPYVCPDCGKGFYDSSSMKKHRRGHGEMQGKGPLLMNASGSDQPEVGEIPSVIMQQHLHHTSTHPHTHTQDQQQQQQQQQQPVNIIPLVSHGSLVHLPHTSQEQQVQQVQHVMQQQEQQHMQIQHEVQQQQQQNNVQDMKYLKLCGKKFQIE